MAISRAAQPQTQPSVPPGLRRRSGAIAVRVAVALALLLLPLAAGGYYVSLGSQVLTFALFAMSLDIIVGFTGLWSLGHAAFFGAAAYAAGLLLLHGLTNFAAVLVVTLLITLLLAVPFGLVALRARRLYFLMLTLALAQVLWGVAYSWQSFTGGDNGLPGIPRPNLWPLPWSLNSSVGFYVFAAVCAVVGIWLMLRIEGSAFGASLQGVRESELRMSALGYNVWLHRYLAYLLSAVFAGLGGFLFVIQNGIVGPSSLAVPLSAEGLLMVILGGAGTGLGPVLGAVVVVLLENVVSTYTDRWLTVLGLIYVLVVLLAPRGLYAWLGERIGGLGRRRSRGGSSAPDGGA